MSDRDQKYRRDDEQYFEYIKQVDDFSDSSTDFIFNFPAFVGDVNLARYLALYEIYKNVTDINGHIADVGTYKGASLIFFAKMVKLFEPYSPTHTYGFDWFQGMAPEAGDNQQYAGKYSGDYERLVKLIECQGLSGIASVCKMNIVEEMAGFLAERPWMRFKLIFLDCGVKDVLSASMEALWPRLVPGGVLVLDHYNMEISPTESDIVDQFAKGHTVRQIPFSRSPTGYLIKESSA